MDPGNISSSSSMRSSNVFANLGRSLGPYSIILTQQKLESGSDDSGCMRRIKMVPEIFCIVYRQRVL